MTNHAPRSATRRSSARIPAAGAAATAAALGVTLLAGCSAGDEEEPSGSRPAPSQRTSQAPPTKAPATKTPGSNSPTPGPPSPERGAFSPYVDTSLSPSYDLLRSARETGVKEYTLAFVSPGDGCVPEWGGQQALEDNPVARQADELRSRGGEVRVSFGGQSGNELARVCGSVDRLVNAYSKVIDAYHLTKVDFDIEGPALTDTKANELRARALAKLQQRRALDVSFTLPVMPSGLNRDSVTALESTRRNGARVSTVNIMAMDYGTHYDGDMGRYAVAAATAAQKQVRTALGIRSEAAAWKAVAVTPMIGVNDVKGEVFRTGDAVELRKFAEKKGLGRLSMWSLTRDKPCAEGAVRTAQATCSSTAESTNAFVKAFLGRT